MSSEKTLRAHRLYNKYMYNAVYQQGSRQKNFPIRITFLKAPENDLSSRVGFIVRKKIGNAVIRNKVRKALRNKCKQELIDYTKEKPTNEIFEDIFSNKLQKTLSLKLKKIYPLSACEIRVLKIEENKE